MTSSEPQIVSRQPKSYNAPIYYDNNSYVPKTVQNYENTNKLVQNQNYKTYNQIQPLPVQQQFSYYTQQMPQYNYKNLKEINMNVNDQCNNYLYFEMPNQNTSLRDIQEKRDQEKKDMDALRKNRKNGREKQRRLELSIKFDYLDSLLPSKNKANKSEKLTVLDDAIAHIKDLQQENSNLKNTISTLQEKVKNLQSNTRNNLSLRAQTTKIVQSEEPSDLQSEITHFFIPNSHESTNLSQTILKNDHAADSTLLTMNDDVSAPDWNDIRYKTSDNKNAQSNSMQQNQKIDRILYNVDQENDLAYSKIPYFQVDGLFKMFDCENSSMDCLDDSKGQHQSIERSSTHLFNY